MTEDFRRVFLPYCLQKLDDGRYIVLNRLYKPLGVMTSDWIKYEDHPSACKIKGLTAKRASLISHRGLPDLESIHLYADGSIPTDSKENMNGYSQRLAALAKLTVESK